MIDIEWRAYQWDGEKDHLNKIKHGVSFDNARLIFDNDVVIRCDGRRDYGEDRYLATGYVGTVALTVVFTIRDRDICRIITARRANRHEREACHAAGVGPPPGSG